MGQDINALGSLGAANQAQAQAQLNATRMNEHRLQLTNLTVDFHNMVMH